MTYVYEANIDYSDEDGVWYVDFPQFDGAFTDGETVEDAARAAADVLTLFVAGCIDNGEPLPEPVFSKPPKAIVSVEVTDAVILETKCLTVTQAAEELDVTPGRVSQLLSSGGLQAVEVNGRRLVTITSVNERKANPPAAHRPRKQPKVA